MKAVGGLMISDCRLVISGLRFIDAIEFTNHESLISNHKSNAP